MGKDNSMKGRGRVWSGTLSFGLVSIPVDFISAKRSSNATLKMVSESGKPLRKVYFCSKDDKKIDTSQIVRGYEVEKGKFVAINDEELEGLAPDKSRDITIDSFVPLEQIDPVYFEQSYFLLPAKKSSGKPYVLLMDAMRRQGKAAIADFVMRGKEHIVAVFPDRGILHAQTLRYSNEVRNTDNLNIPSDEKIPAKLHKSMTRFLKSAAQDDLPYEELTDEKNEKLQALFKKHTKRAKKKTKTKPKPSTPLKMGMDEGDNVVEIMDLIKRRLHVNGNGKPRRTRRSSDLEEKSKDELYAQAKDLDIAGRSAMNKRQLAAAIEGVRH